MTDSEGDVQNLDSQLRDVAPQLLAALKGRDINSLDADTTARILRSVLSSRRDGDGNESEGVIDKNRGSISTGGGGGGYNSSAGAGVGGDRYAIARIPFNSETNGGGGGGGGEGGASNMTVNRKARRPQAQTKSPAHYKTPSFQKNLASQVGYLCIADEFNLEMMKAYYDRQHLRTTLEYDVLSVHKPSIDGSMRRDKDAFSIFLFKYGSVVFWGTPVSFKAIIEPDFVLAPRPNSEIAQAMEGRYPVEVVATNFPVYCTYEIVPQPKALLHGSGSGAPETDRDRDQYQFEVGKQLFERTLRESDHFKLPSRNSDELKLCISHALAQSAKIEYMELKIQELTQKCKPLPRELKDKGSVTIAERALLQLRGEVLYYRLMLKSGSDLLDEPELFWEHEQLKPYFYATKDFFDISERVRVLDAKLDASNEILGMLSDQFSQRHSSRLEWIVIWLVLVEVIIGVLELMLDLKPWSRLF